MALAGKFFKPWDLPVFHPGRPTCPLPMENERPLSLLSVPQKI